jgi:hypothetical protein
MKLEHTAGGRARRRSRAAGICTFAISTLPGGIAGELYLFYRYHRAALQARLAIALREPNPGTPEKWPTLARSYLRIAVADAVRGNRLLRTRGGRRGRVRRGNDG